MLESKRPDFRTLGRDWSIGDDADEVIVRAIEQKRAASGASEIDG